MVSFPTFQVSWHMASGNILLLGFQTRSPLPYKMQMYVSYQHMHSEVGEAKEKDTTPK